MLTLLASGASEKFDCRAVGVTLYNQVVWETLTRLNKRLQITNVLHIIHFRENLHCAFLYFSRRLF